MAVLLAGCASESPAEATLTVHFGPDRDDARTFVVGFDPSHRPALPAYQQEDAEHPDFYSVHDLTVQWSEDEGIPIQTGYFDGLGFTLDSVDGVAGTFSETACWFWSLTVDGEASEVGMGDVPVEDGSEVVWTYTDCS